MTVGSEIYAGTVRIVLFIMLTGALFLIGKFYWYSEQTAYRIMAGLGFSAVGIASYLIIDDPSSMAFGFICLGIGMIKAGGEFAENSASLA